MASAVRDFDRGWTAMPATAVPFIFSDHTVKQAMRRLHLLTEEAALRRLYALIPDATVRVEPPEWVNVTNAPTELWFVSEDEQLVIPMMRAGEARAARPSWTTQTSIDGSGWIGTTVLQARPATVGASVRWVGAGEKP